MTTANSDTLEQEYNRPWGEFLLWFGVLGPAIAWSIYLAAMYALTQSACAHHSDLPLHIATVVMLAISLLGLVVAWRDFARLGSEWPSSREGGVIERSRFMSAIGLFLGAIFSLLIVCQWATVFFLRPCVM